MARAEPRIDSAAVDFEKWQALGNDYLIVEQQALPFELTSSRIQAMCAAHTGVGADGVLLLSDAEPPRMQVFNPDGSEAEVSGNGARQAILYLHRHGYSGPIQTVAGELKPTITSPTTCTVDMGRARLQSDDYPAGSGDGVGELRAAGRTWRFQHVQVGNPQCSIRMDSEQELESLDLEDVGPQIEHHELFPNRTNVSFFTPVAPGQIRARIFERGVGKTSASGTGAAGAAVAYIRQDGSSPVTVVLDGGELEVDVGQDLGLALSGWAVPVFRGTVAEELVKELRAVE